MVVAIMGTGRGLGERGFGAPWWEKAQRESKSMSRCWRVLVASPSEIGLRRLREVPSVRSNLWVN